MALNTSGRAVLIAGLTICIALLGMFALQVSFLYGVALSATFVVALTMLASLTLLPAMLGFFGLKALRRGERRRLEHQGAQPEEVQGFWLRWAQGLSGRAGILSIISLAVIVVLALPFFSLRLGLDDAGNDPTSSTTRQAYDLLAQGFGPGFNGPLQIVGKMIQPGRPAALRKFRRLAAGLPRCGGGHSAPQSPNGQAEVAIVFPKTAPQDAQTTTLLHRLRHAAAAGRSRQLAGGARRRCHRHRGGFLPRPGPEDPPVRGCGRPARLPPSDGGLPQHSGAAGGVDHEPALHRCGPGDHDRRLPVGLGQVTSSASARQAPSRCSCPS